MKSRLLGAVCACLLSLITLTCHAVTIQPLQGRLETSPGSGIYQAYYDPNLDITWATNANINGAKKWDIHNTLKAALDIGGVTGWRLPSADVNGDGMVVDCFGGGVIGCSDNEMGFLYWEEGITFNAQSPFHSIRAGSFYSGTKIGSFIYAHNFGNGGLQVGTDGNFAFDGWAVRNGDVGVVPVPAAVWLFGSGLLGLIGISRRKKAA